MTKIPVSELFSLGTGKPAGVKDKLADKAKNFTVDAALTILPGGPLVKVAAKVCLKFLMDRNNVGNEMVMGKDDFERLSILGKGLIDQLPGASLSSPSRSIKSSFFMFNNESSNTINNIDESLKRGAFNAPIPRK